MIHFHDSCDFALLRQLTWMWFLKVIVSEPFSHNYTRLHHPLLQIRLWTRCYDSKHASSHPHDMETMAWWFHKVAVKFFMSMKNSLCFSACVEFHAPVIIILALLAWHFPKWALFWFQPFSWMFSNPINDKSSQSKSYLYQWKCFPTLYLDICAFAEVNKDVNRGRGIAAGGEGEHWSSPKLQKRATAETARTQPGTQTGSAVTLRTATRRINRFPTTSNVSVCCAAWHNNSQSENISHIR